MLIRLPSGKIICHNKISYINPFSNYGDHHVVFDNPAIWLNIDKGDMEYILKWEYEPRLSNSLELLALWMKDHPSAEIIKAANEVVYIFGGEYVPDWVHALANGNPDAIDDVIAVALADYEEAQRASDL